MAVHPSAPSTQSVTTQSTGLLVEVELPPPKYSVQHIDEEKKKQQRSGPDWDQQSVADPPRTHTGNMRADDVGNRHAHVRSSRPVCHTTTTPTRARNSTMAASARLRVHAVDLDGEASGPAPSWLSSIKFATSSGSKFTLHRTTWGLCTTSSAGAAANTDGTGINEGADFAGRVCSSRRIRWSIARSIQRNIQLRTGTNAMKIQTFENARACSCQ